MHQPTNCDCVLAAGADTVVLILLVLTTLSIEKM